MVKFPVIHEVVTSFQCIGDVIVLNPKRARERWRIYAKESVIGSGVYALHKYRKRDKRRARELAKGMGRAIGQVLLGGGLFKDVPVFHELATAGKSLGHMIGGGDRKAAEKEWDDYAHDSVAGSLCFAIHKLRTGHKEEAKELVKAMGKATGKAVVTVTVVGICTVSGGLAAPLGSAAASGIGAVVGTVTCAGGSAASQAIDGKTIDKGEVIGAGLLGGVANAFAGYTAGTAVKHGPRAGARAVGKTGIKAVVTKSATNRLTKPDGIVDFSRLVPASAATNVGESAVISGVCAGASVAVSAVAAPGTRTTTLEGEPIDLFAKFSLIWWLLGIIWNIAYWIAKIITPHARFKKFRLVVKRVQVFLKIVKALLEMKRWMRTHVVKPLCHYPWLKKICQFSLYVLQPVCCLSLLTLEKLRFIYFQHIFHFRCFSLHKLEPWFWLALLFARSTNCLFLQVKQKMFWLFLHILVLRLFILSVLHELHWPATLLSEGLPCLVVKLCPLDPRRVPR